MSSEAIDVVEVEYWEVVRLCLIEIFGNEPELAAIMVADRRKQLHKLGRRVEQIALHQEPFYTAGEIAGRDIEVDGYDEQYDDIRARVEAQFPL